MPWSVNKFNSYFAQRTKCKQIAVHAKKKIHKCKTKKSVFLRLCIRVKPNRNILASFLLFLNRVYAPPIFTLCWYSCGCISSSVFLLFNIYPVLRIFHKIKTKNFWQNEELCLLVESKTNDSNAWDSTTFVLLFVRFLQHTRHVHLNWFLF